MSKIKTKKTIITKEHIIYEVSYQDILEFLKIKGYELPENSIDIYVRVPGGGNLDIDNHCPIYVSFVKESVSTICV